MDAAKGPIVKSWAGCVQKLFEGELEELDRLLETDENTTKEHLNRIREQIEEEFLFVGKQRPPTGSPNKNQTPNTTGARIQKVAAGGGGPGGNARQAHSTPAEELDRLVQTRFREAQQRREQEPWVNLARECRDQELVVKRVSDTVLEKARREYEFFSGRPETDYTMDDILCDRFMHVREEELIPIKEKKAGQKVTPERVGGKKNESPDSKADGSMKSSGKRTRAANTPPPIQRQPPPVDGSQEVINEKVRRASHPCIVIDAIEFARKYNEALQTEYGYKPILGSHLPVASAPHSIDAENKELLLEKLKHHGPGLGTASPEFCIPPVSTTNCVADKMLSAATFPARSADQTKGELIEERQACVAETVRISPCKNRELLPTAEVHPNQTISHSSRDAARDKTISARKGSSKEGSDHTSKGVSSPIFIECSAKNNQVNLATTVGTEASCVVRFTNRNAKRYRFRTKAAQHPWLSFKCVRVCPAASGTKLQDTTITKGQRSSHSNSDGPSTTPRTASPSRQSPRSTRAGHSNDNNSNGNIEESPLNCGGFMEVEIRFNPSNTLEPFIEEVLQVGYLREVNSRNNEGASWTFFEVKVSCQTSLPHFQLSMRSLDSDSTNDLPVGVDRALSLTTSASEAIDGCLFPVSFVLDSKVLYYNLTNTGSTAIVNLLSTSPAFHVDPSPEVALVLHQGNSVPFSVTFTPTEPGIWDAQLIVAVREDENGPVLSEHAFPLNGEGIIPRIALERIEEMIIPTDREKPQWLLGEGEIEGIPQYFLKQCAPEIVSSLEVVLLNESPIPLPYHWRITSGGPERSTPLVTMRPDRGTLLPAQRTIFILSVTPSYPAEPLMILANLFAGGLPDPSLIEENLLQMTNPLAVRLYQRNRPIPFLKSASDSVVPTKSTDPFSVFHKSCHVPEAKEKEDIFFTGFYLYAEPSIPTLLVVPSILDETVECLVYYENVRHVALRNPTPKPIHFIFSPEPTEYEGIYSGSTARGASNFRGNTHRDEQPIEVKFTPRKGVVPPFSTNTVMVNFMVKEVGRHSVTLDCFVPEIVNQRLALGEIIDYRNACTHNLQIHVTGAGPSAHVSSELLDFGLIEYGKESEASLTVMNHNPIPIQFEVQDPMMREPPRFVFFPPSSKLGAGESAEVTVYRIGVAADDERTFFEIVVKGGNTIAIETRATIQEPEILIEGEPIVDCGENVPEKVWQDRSFFLSNATAFDVPYIISVAVPNSMVEVRFPESGVVLAGQHHLEVPIQCCFTHPDPEKKGTHPDEATMALQTLLSIKSTRTSQELYLEVCCQSVERLGVTLDLIPIPPTAGNDGILNANLNNMLSASDIPAPLPAPIYDFARSLICNTIELAIAQKDGSTSELILSPYCAPILLQHTASDNSSVSKYLLALIIHNVSGCESYYTARTLNYTATRSDTAVHDSSQKSCNSVHELQQGTCNEHGFLQSVPSLAETSNLKTKEVNLATTKGNIVSSSVPRINDYQSAFWATAQKELEDRTRQAAIAVAQEQLIDGRGLSSSLAGAVCGPLGSHELLRLPLTLSTNLPGRYHEVVQVSYGEGLPKVNIPLTLELTGKAVLMDPTTPGLTCIDGKETLIMPSVVAAVGTARRSLKLVNHVPRDLDVSVFLFLSTSTFSLVAIDEDVEASKVTLQMALLSDAENEKLIQEKGHASATPKSFFLPAMSTTEVVLEYSPSLNAVASLLAKNSAAIGDNAKTGVDDSCELESNNTDSTDMKLWETEWRGCLTITAEISSSTFNDAFLIDDYYRERKDQYPSQRRMGRRKPGEKGYSSSAKSNLLSQPFLMVLPPFRTRPGVVFKNRLVQLTDAEKKSIDMGEYKPLPSTHMNDTLRSNSNGNFSRENSRAAEGSDSDDSSNESVEASHEKGTGTLVASATKSLQQLHSEAQERQELLAYLQRRRQEVKEESRIFFSPIELSLRGRCGIPRLSIHGSSSVSFPPYHRGRWCGRTVRLSNLNSSSIRFKLDVVEPSRATDNQLRDSEYHQDPSDVANPPHGLFPFRIISTDLVPGVEVEEDPLQEENEESRRVRQMLEQLRWTATSPKERSLRKKKKTNTGGSSGARKLVDEKGIYTLGGSDALDVTIEFSPQDIGMWLKTYSGGSVEAALRIRYISDDISEHSAINQALLLSTLKSAGSDKNLQGQRQRHNDNGNEDGDGDQNSNAVQNVPLFVKISRPSISCQPSTLWFKPGQLRHDGRPQPCYPQRLTLSNMTEEEVEFEILPIPNDASNKEGLLLTPEQLNQARKIRQVIHPDGNVQKQDEDDDSNTDEGSVRLPPLVRSVVDDPRKFIITPMRGVVPSSSRGGRPGTITLSVKFLEHSNLRFESLFYVNLKFAASYGAKNAQNDMEKPAVTFLLRGDSRETEI